MVLLLLLLFVVQKTEAQFFEKFKFWKEDTLKKKDGIFILPLLYYTPDTRWAAGIVGVYYFNTAKDKKAGDTRLSYVKLLGDYTQNKQLDLWSSWNIFTDKEKYLFKGEMRYRNFPDRFYGIGNQTPESNEEFYAYDLFNFKILAMRQVYKKLFVGLDYQFSYEYNFKREPDGSLNTGNITGFDGGTGSAVGAVMTYDTRDNVVNAYSGMLFETSTYLYSSALGGSFDYTNINFTFSKYWEVRENHIIAVNAVTNLNFGNVPFLDMSKVGGDDILRGYAKNRFRDHHFSGIQVEYRFPVWWRFGMAVFTGVGDVYRKPSDIGWSTLKYTFGAGIRFSVNQAERLNVRFDYGIGRKSDAFYIMLTEAF